MPNRYTGMVQERNEKGKVQTYDSYRDEKGREWLYDQETNLPHRSKKNLEAEHQARRERQTTDSNNK